MLDKIHDFLNTNWPYIAAAIVALAKLLHELGHYFGLVDD